MHLTINRRNTTGLYTTGELIINNKKVSSTVEPSVIMLPKGRYKIALNNVNCHLREIVISKLDNPNKKKDFRNEENPWKIGTGNSWIDARKHKAIIIGKPLIPGALCKGAKDYNRLMKRLEKCKDRKEAIYLTISDTKCTKSMAAYHWLRP